MAARRKPVDREARAKTLHAERIDVTHIRVWGGESEWVLEQQPDGTYSKCRCPDHGVRAVVCAHIIRAAWLVESEAAGTVVEEGPGLERDVPLPESIDEEEVDAPVVADPPSAVVGTIMPPTDLPASGRAVARAADPAVKAPWSNEAEQAVLGAMLLDQAAALKAAAILDETMFYREGHRLLFHSMVSLTARGDVIDPVTLRDELERRGDLDRAGGMEYIAVLIDVVPTAANVDYHAGIVRKKAHRRAAAQAGLQLTAAALDPTVDLAGVWQAYDRARELLTESAAPRFRLLTVEELGVIPPSKWLLEPFVRAGALTVLYGPSGAFKTFLALGQVCAIAAGVPWLGRPTIARGVVYAAGEGGGELHKRIEAWKESESAATLKRLRIIAEGVNLFLASEVDALLANVAATFQESPGVFVFDTLADSMDGGDENATKDMNIVANQARRIMRHTGAAVVLIHHTGRDETRPKAERGAIVLRGKADVMFKVTSEDGMLLTLENDKQRDRPELEALSLRLHAIGDSLVVQPNEGAAMKQPTMGKNHWRLLRALRDNFQGAESAAMALLKVSAVPEGSFYRTIKELDQFKYITKHGQKYVLTTAGESALGANYQPLSKSHHDSGPPTINHSGGLI